MEILQKLFISVQRIVSFACMKRKKEQKKQKETDIKNRFEIQQK